MFSVKNFYIIPIEGMVEIKNMLYTTECLDGSSLIDLYSLILIPSCLFVYLTYDASQSLHEI